MSGGKHQNSVLVVVILSVLGPSSVVDSNVVSCIQEEREALLVFKQGLVDEYGYLSSWGKEDDQKNCCKWRGVQCDNRTGHVNVIDLSGVNRSKGLIGTISPSLLKLHHLSYLDLSNNSFKGIRIPEFIGSIFKLKHLGLSRAGFGGAIPHQLGNLSRLQFLDLSLNDDLYSVGNLEWLSHLSSLRYLDLSRSDLSKSSDWFQVVGKLPFLKTLQLTSCSLPPIIPSSLSLINSTASLVVLDLSSNNLTSSIYSWLFKNVSSNLVVLNLDFNGLQGRIPDAFGHMSTSLRSLSLKSNDLEGEIPKFFGNMCSLNSLDLSSNNLRGQLSGSIQNLFGECKETPVERLRLDGNEFRGSIPDLTRFSSLKNLGLAQNRLNGTLTKSIAHLLKLEFLVLSGNSLKGAISEAFLSNLSNLHVLELADSPLALEFSHDWIPPFQLVYLILASCKIGPHFPKWLQTQKHLEILDISNSGISDTVPDEFWDIAPRISLNLSHNKIRGRLPDLSMKFSNFVTVIDISSNHFEGPITTLPSSLRILNMSRNKFLGTISLLCSVISQNLTYLDLSSNQLSGRLPDCWQKFPQLSILNLADNGFSGNIPHSMGALSDIQTLSLRNNNFSGDLPSSLENCTKLRVLDLGKNSLSGKVPAWIGDSLSDLIVLSLQSNRFLGNIPFQLCNLADIQILDLSLNNISGTIPVCFSNFTVMTQERSFLATIMSNNFGSGIINRYLIFTYFDSAMLKWKGHEYEYKNNLGLVKILDLSSNKLGGTIPGEIMSLVGLIALNLSRNNLTGQINRNIGQLQLLDFLDLSRNQFYGEIPSSLSLITRLSVLDLSNNNLSGKIPLGTQLEGFNASVYEGNPGLCGLPLPTKCPWEEPAQGPNTSTPEDEDQFITLGFYVSMVLGFVVGFWGVCGTLLLNNSWRHTYFNFLTSIKDWLHETTAVTIARQQGRLTQGQSRTDVLLFSSR